MSEREDERPNVNPGSTKSPRDDDRQDPLRSRGARAFGDSAWPRPPEVHHAQRRDLRGRGDDRLHAIGDRSKAPAADACGGRLRQPPAVPLSPT